jgi:hypothetical protein
MGVVKISDQVRRNPEIAGYKFGEIPKSQASPSELEAILRIAA